MDNQYRIRQVVEAVKVDDNLDDMKAFAGDQLSIIRDHWLLQSRFFLFNGDYVVKAEDGLCFPVPAYLFEAMFGKVEENG